MSHIKQKQLISYSNHLNNHLIYKSCIKPNNVRQYLFEQVIRPSLDAKQERIHVPDFVADRSLMWILAYQDYNGEYVNDSVKGVAGKIVSIFDFLKDVTKT